MVVEFTDNRNFINNCDIHIMEGLKYIFIISLLKIYVLAEDPIIDTTTGTIKGSTFSVQNVDIDVFLGIPFAKPPVGNLRFKRPEPIERWSGIKETKKHVSSCIQLVEAFDHIEGADSFKVNTNISEDCLYLNIWAPTEARKSHSNLATMIWIYGGALVSGTSTLDAYDGRFLAASQKIIVASLNYRVGPFGFLSLNDERAPGNMGLLDQTLAISWIRDNIASFGGDPDKLTLFGQSAGAISVSFHVMSPISRKIFRNAIIMSGIATTDWSVRSKEGNIERAKEMAAFLKCPTENDKVMLDCFLNADANNISMGQYYNFKNITEFPFAPIIDNYFLQEKPKEIVQNKKMKKDVMIGFLKNEGSLMILIRYPEYFAPNTNVPVNKSVAHKMMRNLIEPKQLNSLQLESISHLYGSHVDTSSETEKYRYILDQVAGDIMFKCPTINFSKEFSTYSNVYMYSFEYRPKVMPWPEWMGVIHGSDVYFAFSQLLSDEKYSPEVKFVSKMLSSYFANFSKSGNPNNGDCSDCSSEPWSKYTPESQKYLVIDEKPRMASKETSLYSICSFWSDLLPQLKEPSCPAGESQNDWTFQLKILTSVTAILFILKLFQKFLF
ncbi:cholinesterase 2-like isoform X3 [Octopus sinensis]|uniref:Carboxylic ester hydrolase n=1 Tax=Octopus sinensis TaxID=2607531 RepID=A0A6P7STP6_9MOLL|nr:cholinesterase 2-like isoform X3 [Octopus sinensis]